MTIKKPINKTAAEDAPVAPVTGGATIADRFKLDLPEKADKKPAGAGTLVTVVAGLLALAVVGVLTFILFQHWEFLQTA